MFWIDDEIVINGEVYVRKSSSVINTSIDSIHEKLERKNAENMLKNSSDNREDDADGIPMSVNFLKQKLRNASMGRVTNGMEIGAEPVKSDVFVGSNTQETVTEEEGQETAQINQQRNNTFMKRNVKTREWSSIVREAVNEEKEIPDDLVITKPEGRKNPVTNTNIIAKEVEAVDTLRRKLEMKKLESKQETFGNNQSVVLRKNEKSFFQNGFVENEEPANIFKTDKKTEDKMSPQTGSLTMVNVTPSRNPTARISFSSFDKSKEDYVSQFSEKTRPISEASPIKAQLESIISGKVQENSAAKDIVFTTQSKEDEEKAKQAAVKAMELAFLKKKKEKEEEERKEEEVENTEQNEENMLDAGIPVPAKRSSLKNRPQTEYTDMARKSELNSSITIVEFSKSGTDYANVTKINKIN